MKSLFALASIVAVGLLSISSAQADLLINCADDVSDYSMNIQNYDGMVMDDMTTWWLTGASDGTVGGWRSNAPDEFIVMQWATGLVDQVGDDLTIRLYGGSSAQADVLASVDGNSFTTIGTIGSGTPLVFREETFDFGGLFAADISYVKVVRVANGPQTGIFFDSFSGLSEVPEPDTVVLLLTGVLGIVLYRRRCKKSAISTCEHDDHS